jgi:hypothetical protein
MNEETYLNLLSLLTPLIEKQVMIMREAATPHERLPATLRFLATGRSYEGLKYSTSTKVWTHRSHLHHCQCDEILEHFSFLFYRFACASAACSGMHNYNSFNLQAACTITMLAQNYHRDAQVCLCKKIGHGSLSSLQLRM